ncbi:Por secretion system C-terminal sorting domain-containing protein [Hymenobacter daecheongensis DSM 21074]|uniref:Por secretion system C-terminal sorting domain-containing protein n=1 Tax=Hymenobacter daecheongensis DSM 21074 TaxID=1121955 RepID=A0A1M6D756_9BACT|nr:DUF4331 family protein [Hymenobacter daecheongensis]SHI69013.1 Por secretion system C-terminal sorting domain-containing protein [Hymenobacter daecheongensis DSM 21074]
MKKTFTRPILHLSLAATAVVGALAWSGQNTRLEASSHREAPLIADDLLADNTDVYAFRDPTNSEMINIIANFIPFQLPQGGPNYYHFGENIRYEIHVKNDATTVGDDITYRFTFTRTNQDPTTHFNIRLGKENLKTTYTLEQSIKGAAFTTLVTNGIVPPYNVGPRAITGAAGLGAASYEALFNGGIQNLPSGGGRVFCGPVDDPFFVDIGGIEDLGGIRSASARDGLYHKNANAIALQIPISALQKTGKTGAQAANILDPDYVIGVWASASRPAIRTLNTDGTQTTSGAYVQVSRLGMPLTNEVVNPIGNKDEYNARTPYNENRAFDTNFVNPELSLYMADDNPVNGAAPKPPGQTYYGEAVPGFNKLRIQSKSLAGRTGLPANGFDFRNGANGLSVLTTAQRAGTVFADPTYGPILLQAGKPRSVDLLPIFQTGVPNLAPYQLATGKNGNPLAAGKPFINNFLPTLGDMLRLNMAVPTTPRNSADFSSEGLLAAAVLGLTDARFNTTTTLQAIPNMDGFPNGRRLEDDVVRIELQAVGGVVLASLGLWYDDFGPAATNPVTPQLNNVLTFTTGIERNDTTLRAAFPYMQLPWSGTKAQPTVTSQRGSSALGLQSSPVAIGQNYPNPFNERTTFHYEVAKAGPLTLTVTDMMGRKVATVFNNKEHKAGTYDFVWKVPTLAAGTYIATVKSGATVLQSIKLVHTN